MQGTTLSPVMCLSFRQVNRSLTCPSNKKKFACLESIFFRVIRHYRAVSMKNYLRWLICVLIFPLNSLSHADRLQKPQLACYCQHIIHHQSPFTLNPIKSETFSPKFLCYSGCFVTDVLISRLVHQVKFSSPGQRVNFEPCNVMTMNKENGSLVA